jgi:ATP-dependent protease ClpP protease subunit
LKRSIIYTVLSLILVSGMAYTFGNTTREVVNKPVATPVIAAPVDPVAAAPQTVTVLTPKAQEPVAIDTRNVPVKQVKTDVSNVVLFNTPVVEETVDIAIDLLSQIDNNTVYLVLNSPGGSVIDGTRLMNFIKYSGKNVVTICDNLCASMAFQIFQVGKTRYMTDKAILMAHPASGGGIRNY